MNKTVELRKECLIYAAPCSERGEREYGMKAFMLGHEGGGFDVTFLRDISQRYVSFLIEAESANSLAFQLQVYSSREPGDYVFDMQTGVLPDIRTQVVIDLEWLEGKLLFPEAAPGQLKITCHGRRVGRDEISRIELRMLERYEDTCVWMSPLLLTDEYPERIPLPDVRLIDCMGQYKGRDWKGKQKDAEELCRRLREEAGAAADSGAAVDGPYAKADNTGSAANTASASAASDLTEYGGCRQLRLQEGTGFFCSVWKDGRWWLADPEGYAFFSMGPDCVVIRSDCRVDGVEKWLDWLPQEDDPVYGSLLLSDRRLQSRGGRRKSRMFSFEAANLIRAFGDDWYEQWSRMVIGQLKEAGLNTLGNWSDEKLFDRRGLPYVTSLPQFPDTKVHIFRDFPDVLSDEYAKSAEECAKALKERSTDPWMIGYFLRNEPAWAFVDNLIVADEVLFCPERTACKDELIRRIRERYGDVESLNRAWKLELADFDELYESRERVSAGSPEAKAFLREFSAYLIREYVRVPAQAARKADPNHMILGMRWAWISDPAVVSGWEYFDAFSINCYAFDPTPAIDNVVKLGVDLPVMIGEFHFGALDAGPVSTGLKAVGTQADRGRAIRYYMEKTATHPYGVGCHYFQCYDQFALGRFDGENYNIGLFDICLQPYEDIIRELKLAAERIYPVAAGMIEPEAQTAQRRPVIAF